MSNKPDLSPWATVRTAWPAAKPFDVLDESLRASAAALAAAGGVPDYTVLDAWLYAARKSAADGSRLEPATAAELHAASVDLGPPLAARSRTLLFSPLSRESPDDFALGDGVVHAMHEPAPAVAAQYSRGGLAWALQIVPYLMAKLLADVYNAAAGFDGSRKDHVRTIVYGPIVDFALTPLEGRLSLAALFVPEYAPKTKRKKFHG